MLLGSLSKVKSIKRGVIMEGISGKGKPYRMVKNVVEGLSPNPDDSVDRVSLEILVPDGTRPEDMILPNPGDQAWASVTDIRQTRDGVSWSASGCLHQVKGQWLPLGTGVSA